MRCNFFMWKKECPRRPCLTFGTFARLVWCYLSKKKVQTLALQRGLRHKQSAYMSSLIKVDNFPSMVFQGMYRRGAVAAWSVSDSYDFNGRVAHLKMKNTFFSNVLRIKVHLIAGTTTRVYSIHFLCCLIYSVASRVLVALNLRHQQLPTIQAALSTKKRSLFFVCVCVFEMSVFKFSLSIGFNYVHNKSWHVCLFVDFSDAKGTYTDVIVRLSSCTASTAKVAL